MVIGFRVIGFIGFWGPLSVTTRDTTKGILEGFSLGFRAWVDVRALNPKPKLRLGFFNPPRRFQKKNPSV